MVDTNRLPNQRIKLINEDGSMSRTWFKFFSNFTSKGFINPFYINQYTRISADGSSFSIEVYNTTTEAWVTKVTYSE